MNRDPRTRLIIAIFSVAAIFAMWQSVSPAVGFGRYWEAPAIARSLVAGRGFSNPFGALETGPTAHLAPVFPAALALLMRLLGDTPGFAVTAGAFCVLAHGLYCVLFIPLSAAIFKDRRPGVAAAIFSALVPGIQVLPQWEAIYAAVGLQLFCIATARWVRPGAVSGLFCGVLLLLNPALLTVVFAWMAYLRPRPRRALAFAAAVLAVLLPWTVRNYRVMGGLFFVRDNLGSELYASNADCSAVRDAENAVNGCQAKLQANRSVAEAAAVRDMGEYAYNRDRMAKARRWIEEHPARFARLTIGRVREFWFPAPYYWTVCDYAQWIVTALSFVGLALLVRARHRSAVFFGGAMLLYPLLYYVVQASPRFRSPVLWLSTLPAAYAVTRWRSNPDH